jgi:cell division septation protein DedD
MSSEELKQPGGLRKRIVGAVVLLGLLVIFLPAFLERVPQDVYISALPPAPVQPAAPSISPADFDNSKNKDATPHQATVAWALQLNSFAVRAKAQEFATQLQQAGYPAYVYRTTERNASVYKVFVGPETKQEKLQTWVQQLKKENIKAQIVEYDPIKN